MKIIASMLSLVLLSTSLASAVDAEKASRPGGYYEQANNKRSLLTPGDGYCPPSQVRVDGVCVDAP